MSVDDYLFALKIHKELNKTNNPSPQRSPANVRTAQPTNSIVDSEWEITDPNPNIHSLFSVFNIKFFWKALGAVEVKWSPRMYTCAGICTYKGKAGCVISLSLPLLKFRPRKDLVETLLHEMIHAYLFVTKNNKDRGSHGPEFCKHMNRINKEAGTQITIYHTFHEEVNHYRTHVWRCNGSCRANPPYFGYVRRATNRAPGPNDFWFAEHLKRCGGTFGKVGEPDNFKAKPRKKALDGSSENPGLPKKKILQPINKNQKDLKNFFSSIPTSKEKPENTSAGELLYNKTESKVGSTISLPSFQGLKAPVHGVASNNEQGGTVVKHGGIKNNIHGFGKLGNASQDIKTGSKSDLNDKAKVPIIPFAGKGYVLGSSSTGKSRLLGDDNISQKGTRNNDTPPLFPSTSSSSAGFFEDLTGIDFEDDFEGSETNLNSQCSSDEDSSSLSNQICPVCSSKLGRGITMNEHLDECAQLEKVFGSSKNYTLSESDSDDNDSDGYTPMSVSSPSSQVSSQLVECPNCTIQLAASSINEHLDQCLSMD